MDVYDAAVKVIFSRCRDVALEYFLGLGVEESEVIELPQETVTVRRADIPIKVKTRDGKIFVVLIEVQSRWERRIPLRLLEYDVRYRIKTGLSVLPVVFLLRGGGEVLEEFSDGGIHYRFRVISLGDKEAREVIDSGKLCLLPFVPLMRGGLELLSEAERLLVEAPFDRVEKADLFTSMALLCGLVSKEICRELITRRRDIMMESFGYELIKREGYEEGLQQGLQQGIQQGKLEEAQEMVLEVLSERFNLIPDEIEARVKAIKSRRRLKDLHRYAIRVKSVEEFLEALR